MPRTRKLTWAPGAGGRKGRWRKKYRGVLHYFDGGRGKSDDAAYQAALTQWQTVKAKIDLAAPSPHHGAYAAAIAQWEEVLTCSRRNGDDPMGNVALEKLGRLRSDQQRGVRKPPSREDLFANYFLPEVRRPKLEAAYREIGALAESLVAATLPSRPASQDPVTVGEKVPSPRSRAIVPEPNAMFQPDPLTIESVVWEDRLKTMRRQAVDQELTIKVQLQRFLALQGSKVDANQLSLGRQKTLGIHLNSFADWLGGGAAVNEISGQKLLAYRAYLLEQVTLGKWTLSTASERLGSVKSFVRWLWRTEAIKSLPRLLDAGCHELEIGKSRGAIETFTKAEIGRLLSESSPRTRLYILLTLNTAMTQKDISDLNWDEVDWQAGRIIRKRSKTRRFDATPIVSYKLWPETFTLLTSERSSDGAGRVLLNVNGGPLWSESMDDAGAYRKVDNIRSAFDRLRRKLGIAKPFKCLKKTAASEIAGSKEYRSLRGLFLGHAPTALADIHYANAPVELFDEALLWLRHKLIAEAVESS